MMSVSNIEHQRAIKIIQTASQRLQLNLEGLIVLTEVGSGHYIYTPLIPLLAGAKKVNAFVKESIYGKAEKIAGECMMLANTLNVVGHLEFFTNSIPDNIFSEADIITNSGMLRPFTKEKLDLFASGAILPLMFESWELRVDDVDIDYCREKNIKVAGTWEAHPDVQVFEHVGILAVKMLLEAGSEVLGNNVFIWSDDKFGETISYQLQKCNVAGCTVSTNKAELFAQVGQLDVVFIADYDELGAYHGKAAPFDLNQILKRNPLLKVIHLYGNVDIQEIEEQYRQNIYPQKNGSAQKMSFTLGHVGMLPVINLLVAGFKVGEELYHNRLSNLSQRIV